MTCQNQHNHRKKNSLQAFPGGLIPNSAYLETGVEAVTSHDTRSSKMIVSMKRNTLQSDQSMRTMSYVAQKGRRHQPDQHGNLRAISNRRTSSLGDMEKQSRCYSTSGVNSDPPELCVAQTLKSHPRRTRGRTECIPSGEVERAQRGRAEEVINKTTVKNEIPSWNYQAWAMEKENREDKVEQKSD